MLATILKDLNASDLSPAACFGGGKEENYWSIHQIGLEVEDWSSTGF